MTAQFVPNTQSQIAFTLEHFTLPILLKGSDSISIIHTTQFNQYQINNNHTHSQSTFKSQIKLVQSKDDNHYLNTGNKAHNNVYFVSLHTKAQITITTIVI